MGPNIPGSCVIGGAGETIRMQSSMGVTAFLNDTQISQMLHDRFLHVSLPA